MRCECERKIKHSSSQGAGVEQEWFESMFGWLFWVREHLHQRQEPRDGCGAAAEIDVLHHHRVIFAGSDSPA